MNVQKILESKGRQVHCIAPDATLADVARELVDKNCGSLLVMENKRLAGIITERDILRACAADGGKLSELKVREKMTKNLVTGTLADEVGAVMGLLTTERVRHLPILENGELAGLISIGDVVKAQHDQLCLENHYLKDYIQR